MPIHRSTKGRHTLKARNPQKYAEYLQRQKKRAKESRDRLKVELKRENPHHSVIERKERERLLNKERQQRHRDKQKFPTVVKPIKNIAQTKKKYILRIKLNPTASTKVKQVNSQSTSKKIK